MCPPCLYDDNQDSERIPPNADALFSILYMVAKSWGVGDDLDLDSNKTFVFAM